MCIAQYHCNNCKHILPHSGQCNATLRLTLLMICNKAPTNTFRLVLHNIASILPHNSECNAKLRLTFCTILLMISNNTQMRFSQDGYCTILMSLIVKIGVIVQYQSFDRR